MIMPYLKSSKKLFTFLLFTPLIAGLFHSINVAAEVGQETFQAKCSACHTIGGGRRVGPDLSGVTDRRTTDWLKRFIKSPQSVIKSGDADAKALYAQFNNVMMPDHPLKDGELQAVIAYMKSQSKTGGGGEIAKEATAEAAPTTEATAETAPATETESSKEEVIVGQNLFQGKQRFKNGGAACNSCHNVRNDAVIGGGVLAVELTDVFSRMGGGGVKAILGSPPFPVMEQAYRGKDLVEAEIRALIAFFKQADHEKAYQQPRDYGVGLASAGAIGTIVLFAIYSLFWFRRKKGSVYKSIFDRQVKSTWED